MTRSDTGSSAARTGDEQPRSTADSQDTRREADLSKQNVNEPVAEVARRSPWYAGFVRMLPRSTGWIVTLLAGSLLVPAITKQWSDRPRELEIKTSLVREISELTTDTVTTPRFVLTGSTPAARVLEEARTALARASKAEKADALKRYRAALDAKLAETQTIYTEESSTWRNKGAVVKAQLLAYFSGTTLADEWGAFVDAVTSYFYLHARDCNRTAAVTRLRSYLGGDDSAKTVQWKLLEKSPYSDTECYVGDFQGFLATYSVLADLLLGRQQQILASIMEADMVGFSKGWRDLLSDIVSGGS
jgi:hypothetical protein